MKNSFGSLCREWRKLRRYSQLQLALELDISSKHISFIETGRSLPSREMILKIGLFLCLPKREINRGLYSAGYAPVYAELSYESDDLKYVFGAIEQMLLNHEPYPAIVLNQNWDVVTVNNPAQKLLEHLGFAEHHNLVEAIIADKPATSNILNWHESALTVLVRLRYEISMLGGSKRLEELERRLASCLRPQDDILNIDSSQSVLSIQLQMEQDTLSFFSMIAQLGTVQDVNVSEFKVELMFPADSTTKHYYTTVGSA
ncbi:MAG: helix-turn-helix domain-containing protein [Arenicella sp.]